MKNLFCILCILFTCQRGFSTNNVLENEYYKLIFDIDTGSYTIIDKIHKEVCLENAYYQLNQWKSNDPLFSHEIKEKTASSLYIVSKSMHSSGKWQFFLIPMWSEKYNRKFSSLIAY